MLNRRYLSLVGALALLPQIALGAEFVNRCADFSTVRNAITAQRGKLIELTPDQWQFLRGIYAMNPETPPGLPYGDKAMLARVDGDDNGLVLFIDGDKACTPMRAPPALLSLMDEVAMGNINHQGAGL